jgi:hypothetical protein
MTVLHSDDYGKKFLARFRAWQKSRVVGNRVASFAFYVPHLRLEMRAPELLFVCGDDLPLTFDKSGNRNYLSDVEGTFMQPAIYLVLTPEALP